MMGLFEAEGGETMKVEVLYMEGCRFWKQALEDVQTVLRSKGIEAQVVTTPVQSPAHANEAQFLGSPTVRINDVDIEWDIPEDGPYGLKPRTYSVEGMDLSSPPREWIDAAIDALR